MRDKGFVKIVSAGKEPMKIPWRKRMKVREAVQTYIGEEFPDVHLHFLSADKSVGGPLNWDAVAKLRLDPGDLIIVVGRMLGDGPGVTDFYKEQRAKYGFTPYEREIQKGEYDG